MDLKRTINLNKKFILIMLFIVGIVLFLSYSYALFQVSFIKNNVVVLQTASNLTITTTIDDTNSDTFTLPASGNKTVVVHLDTNGITSAMAYKMYYELTGTGKFTVTSTDTYTDDKVEGIMQPITKTGYDYKVTGKDLTFTVTNNSSNSLTIKLGAIGGFEKTGASLTTEEELLVNNQLPVVHGINATTLATSKLGTDGLIAVNTNGELYDSSDQTQTIREYRYSVGEDDVKNYIWFNNENWRIVGIFDGKIKIVKDTPIASAPTSYTNKNNDTAFTLQNTTETWAGVQVSRMYWNKGGTRSRYNDWSEAGLMYYLNEENSLASNSYYDTMDSNYKGFIDDNTTYYLGNVVYNTTTPSTAYTQERNTDSSNIWSGNAATWTGKIGLLYPSDYGYATDPDVWNGTSTYMYNYNSVENIKTRNWILKSTDTSGLYWMISPSSNSSNGAMGWNYSGFVSSNSVAYGYFGVRPVLNLKSDAVIVSGEGTSGNPYRLIAAN